MTRHADRTVSPLAPYRKAVAAFVAPAAVALGGAMADGVLERGEVVVAIGAGLVAAGAVYAVPNRPPGN